MKLSRRSALTMLPAATTLLSLRGHAAPIAPEALTSAGFAISVQCWSFREFTLFEAIEMSAAAGAGGVEIFPGQKIGGSLGDAKVSPDLPAEAFTRIQAHLAKHGVRALNFGVTGVSKDEAKARPLFEMAKTLGLYGVTTEDIGSLDTLEKLAIEYDLKVCFHNHPKRPLYKMWDPDFIMAQIRDRHPNVGFCADIGHWATSGLNPLEVIRRVAPRVLAFHMKDRGEIGKQTHDRPFGTGIIDNMAILDEVRKHGFAGNVSIEYEHNWKTSLPEIAQCVGYLRGYAKSRG